MIEAMEQAPAGLGTDDDRSPLRRCIATSALRRKDELVRFVVSPEGQVVPDVTERLPGRGLWLTASRDIVAAASSKGLFAKAAHTSAIAPTDLADQVEALLARRCCDLLGIARRAGQVAAGFEKVRAWLTGGKAGVLLAASDGAEDGRRKLRALAGDVPVIALLRADELSAALGRDNAVHVAVKEGRLAALLLRETTRLSGFRNGAAPSPGVLKTGPKAVSAGSGRRQRSNVRKSKINEQ